MEQRLSLQQKLLIKDIRDVFNIEPGRTTLADRDRVFQACQTEALSTTAYLRKK